MAYAPVQLAHVRTGIGGPLNASQTQPAVEGYVEGARRLLTAILYETALDPEAIAIEIRLSGDVVVFAISVGREDHSGIFSSGNHMVRSLGAVIHAIGVKNERQFQLEVNDIGRPRR